MKEQLNTMIVEDESIIALDLKALLLTLGHKVMAIVSTGKDAIDKAKNLKPDLIFMDINLRDFLTGIEAAEIIRNEEKIPIIYITAMTMISPDLIFPYKLLNKPYRIEDLISVIEETMRSHSLAN